MTDTLRASVVLDRAADQIAKTGLWKGSLWDRDVPTPAVRCCTVGAIRYVASLYAAGMTRLNLERGAEEYVRRLVGNSEANSDVFDWSDAPTTTTEMVVDVLRHAASVARLDEAA